MILMYHNIAPEKDFNTVSLSDFEAQMKYISEHFNPVAADEYIAEIDGANKKGISLLHLTTPMFALGNWCFPL